VNYRSKSPKTTEIILYNDLKVTNEGGTIVELGIIDLKVYKRKPDHCSDCNSTKVIGLEVLGAKNGVLFWICDSCENLHFKFTLKTTERWLDRCKDFWTAPEAWPVPSKELFN
tara:strand:- start:11356 stop:11694 length:339 start_codon:yes stop_codon:yes gene_type:complete